VVGRNISWLSQIETETQGTSLPICVNLIVESVVGQMIHDCDLIFKQPAYIITSLARILLHFLTFLEVSHQYACFQEQIENVWRNSRDRQTA